MTSVEILNSLLQTHTTEIYLKVGQRNIYVRELQNILNALGFGRELNFASFGATGSYDNNTVNAVRAYGSRSGIPSDGRQVTETLLNSMVKAFQQATNPFQPAPPPPQPQPTPPPPRPTPPPPSGGATPPAAGAGKLQMRDEGDKLWISDGQSEVRLVKRDGGYAYWGTRTIEQCVKNNRALMQQIGLTNSAGNVMISVSENEGKLDAINSYDRAFFSYGIFQWTLGYTDGEGELPAMLKKVKNNFPNSFRSYFQSKGLDIHGSTNEKTGLLTLNGTPISSTSQKEQFRKPEWAFYFWKAGQSADIQVSQIEHALARLKDFYWSTSSSYAINGMPLSQIITSEYGVALLLDNHVNRPAYVKPCVEQAMQRTGLTNPAQWGSNEENKVINAYLDIRVTYSSGTAGPMTKARERAQVTQKYLHQGIISNNRGSFQMSPAAV